MHCIGVSQVCYSEPGCTGYVVETPGPTVRDCCVRTNDGQSYADSVGTCIKNQCIGECNYTCSVHVSCHYFSESRLLIL